MNMEEKKAFLKGRDAEGKEIILAEAEGAEAEKMIEDAVKDGMDIIKDPEAVRAAESAVMWENDPDVVSQEDADRLAALAIELYGFVEELDGIWISQNADQFRG